MSFRALRYVLLGASLLTVACSEDTATKAPAQAPAPEASSADQAPDFSLAEVGTGKTFSLSANKGKVVLIDFWATWCGPCVAELPNVLKAYEKHHAKGFEIIGISLDSDQKKLETFVKQKHMTWPQYFDGQGWQNKLAQQYGVNSIPATYLVDRQGNIIASGLRGENLETAIAAALAAK